MIRFLLVLILITGDFGRLWANCTAPSLLSVGTVTDSSAVLTWTDVGDMYEMEIRRLSESFSGVPTHTVPSDPPFTVMGLTPGEQYRFRVRTVCAGGGESTWSVIRNFSTDLNNARPCPLDFTLRDTTCAAGGQVFNLRVDDAPGTALGTNALIKGVRLMITHPWRSDLQVWLTSPDGTRIQLIGGLNAGDQNLGDPSGNGGCGQFVELTSDSTAPLLSAAAEMDNITGFWQSLYPLTSFHTGQNPNGIWRLEICDNKLNHTGKLRLAQLVFEPADCASPAGLVASNIELNAVDLSWNTASVLGDSLQLVYGPAGFIPGTNAAHLELAAGTVIQPYHLSGLSGLQEYEVYIRQQCTPGEWSGYGQPVSFFTVCPATITENFDMLGICPTGCTDPCPLPGLWQNAPGDDYEWKVRTGPGITFPTAGPPEASGGSGNYLFFRNSCSASGANGKKAVLRTLCVDINAPLGTSCHFSLDLYMNTKLGQMGSLLLEVSTNGGGNWQTVRTWTGNQGKFWKREFVNLSAFHGQTVLVQITATGVIGAYGDMAIDNLTFYGAVQAGAPDYTFYRDSDNDGYGATAQKLIACSPVAPAGYVTLPGDCNDLSSAIFPGATEIKCNGIDENCNGNADDQFIPAPVVTASLEVCEGGNIALTLQNPNPVGQYFWFNAASGGQLLGMGSALTLQHLTITTPVWVMDSVAMGGCISLRTLAVVQVLPTPNLVAGAVPEICIGMGLFLGNLPVNDIAQTNGSLTWFAALPFIPANQITSLSVQPAQNTTIYALKTATNSCWDTLEIPVTVYQNPTVNITNGANLSLCKGRAVTLNATGSPNVAFSWSNGLNFNNITVIANGPGGSLSTFSVTATDIHGCSATDQIVLETLSGISQTNVVGIQHVITCGGNDGSIALQPLDGQAPFSFAWTGPNMSNGSIAGIGVNGGVINGLSQGGYRITVTDATGSGCSMVLPSLVINAPGLTVSQPVIVQPLCAGATGSISVQAAGVAPVFSWSNSASAATVTGLLSGTYTVTITDGNCQQILSGLDIVAPPLLQVLENDITSIDCFGSQNGGIDIAVFGGTPGYSFVWSDWSTVEDRSGLNAGSYRVTVTDLHWCTAVSAPILITQLPPVQIVKTVDAVSCFGGNDGSISTVINGGVLPYFVEWNTGQFVTDLLQIPAGTYMVSVTDGNGCMATAAINVLQPPQLQIVNVSILHPACMGLEDGAIAPVVTGGAGGPGGYSYLWSNGQTTAATNQLNSGVYRFTLTDANGCILHSPDYAIAAPQLLSLNIDTLVHVRCFGSNYGAFSLSVNGTVGGFVSLVNGQPASLIQNYLTAGLYQVDIQDSRGCALHTDLNILEPKSPLVALAVSSQQVSCSGEPTGSIDVETTGGTPPYQFLWSNGTETEDLEVILSGMYSLVVTDANNCMAGITNIIIQEPDPIVVVPEVTAIPCYGSPYGKIILQTSGGLPPYAYQWNTGATTQNIYDLPAGNYAVSVFDAAGCLTVYDRLEVVNKIQDFQLVPGIYLPVSCTGGNDGLLRIGVVNGWPPFQYAWSAPVGLHPNSSVPYDDAVNLSGGQYFVTVTDADGCFLSAGPLIVEESPKITVQITDIQTIVCKGEHTGIITSTATGGVPPYEFLWAGGMSTPVADSLPAGLYTLTVTDFRGCTAVSGVINMTEPAVALSIAGQQVEQDVCSRGEGMIDISVEGGFPLYQYIWNTTATTADLESLSAGNYTVTVTDFKGCTTSDSFVLTPQQPPLQLASYSIQEVACLGESTGGIETSISGGNLPLQYFWNNGATTSNIINLASGLYTVTVIDQQDCAAIFNLPEVKEPNLPLSATFTPALLADGFSIALNCSGGTPGYTAVWDNAAGNQTGLVVVGLLKGTYMVTITDAAGCTLIKTISVGLINADDLQKFDNEVVVSPNPFDQLFCLLFSKGHNAPAMVRVFSSAGKIVDLNSTVTDQQVCFETGALSAGLYFIEIRWPNGQKQYLKGIKE